MKHFDNIIQNMIKIHKDPQTQYSDTTMFPSQNDLSFAISRLMDAQYTFTDDILDNKGFTIGLRTLWFSLRDTMPSETANNLALCIMKNTPFSNTTEQTNEIKDLFSKTMITYTNSTELAEVFTEIFFGEAEAKMPRMKDH